MIITIIAAMAENRTIGQNNAIPWQLPADLTRFKALTMGHPVIMGRKTYESIGRPLPGRKTIIVTRQPDYRAKGCLVTLDLQSALDLAEGTDEVFICGGGELYRQALPLANRVYLTVVHKEFDGDTFFPELSPEFDEVARETLSVSPLPCTFIEYRKKPRD